MNVNNLELSLLQVKDVNTAANILKKAYGKKISVKDIEQRMRDSTDYGDSIYVVAKIKGVIRGVYRMNTPQNLGEFIFVGEYGHLATEPEKIGIGYKMFKILGNVFENVASNTHKPVFNMGESKIKSTMYTKLGYSEKIDFEETVEGDLIEKYIYTKKYAGEKQTISLSESKIVDKIVEYMSY